MYGKAGVPAAAICVLTTHTAIYVSWMAYGYSSMMTHRIQ